LECLKEIETYNANEVHNTLKLFNNSILNLEQKRDQSVVERIVVVLILLKRRSQFIMEEFADLRSDDESFCDNGATDIDLQEMVVSCGKMLSRLFYLSGNDQDLQRRILEVDCFRAACSDVFQVHQLRLFSK
jgi:hypothetical protein